MREPWQHDPDVVERDHAHLCPEQLRVLVAAFIAGPLLAAPRPRDPIRAMGVDPVTGSTLTEDDRVAYNRREAHVLLASAWWCAGELLAITRTDRPHEGAGGGDVEDAPDVA